MIDYREITNPKRPDNLLAQIGIDFEDSEIYGPALYYRHGSPSIPARVEEGDGTYKLICQNVRENLYQPFTIDFRETTKSLDLDFQRMSILSKTAAVVDVQKGVKDRVLNLQPEILLWDIVKSHFGENDSDPGTFDKDFDYRTAKYSDFIRKNSELLFLLGINKTEALNLSHMLTTLDVHMNAGDLPMVGKILQIDPHVATIYFGHKTSEILGGYIPSARMMTLMEIFLSRNLEMAPHDIDPQDYVTRSEWANTLNLFRDSVFGLAFPNSFRFTNGIATLKTGVEEPLSRQFQMMNGYGLKVFGVESLSVLSEYPTLWVEKRPKGLLRSCQKAVAPYTKELTEIFLRHTEVHPVTMTNSDLALTGFEVLLGIEKPDIQERELAERIKVNMFAGGDDLAFKAFFPDKVFDIVIHDLQAADAFKKGMVTKVYGSNGLQHASTENSITLGDGPSEEYYKRWKSLQAHNRQDSIYMMAYFKQLVRTRGKGITASIHLAPYNEQVIQSSWRTRLPFTLLEEKQN